MPDFKGTDDIKLQPYSEKNYYRFKFEPATSADGKGAIPFGTTVSSVTVSGYNDTGSDVTTLLLNETPVVSSNVVTCAFDWVSAGNFKVTFYLTLSDDSKWEKDFDRIKGVDT
jgi:hypothetical protein